MPAVRGEGGREVKSGNCRANRQNCCWNVQKNKDKRKKKIATSKQVRDLHHSSAAMGINFRWEL
jgi:hypothetical protein